MNTYEKMRLKERKANLALLKNSYTKKAIEKKHKPIYYYEVINENENHL